MLGIEDFSSQNVYVEVDRYVYIFSIKQEYTDGGTPEMI